MHERDQSRLIGQLRELAAGGDGGLGDAELLRRFATTGDEAAFEVLVWRHRRLVFGVCRRVLGDHHDAEDAFQATFLALARKAGAVGRRGTPAAWLYRVAVRVALTGRTARARRAAREPPADATAEPAAPPDPAPPERRELWAILDEEVARLPERFRAAVALCYLGGLTVDEAARQLGCPRGTVASRLARARARLHTRLTRRGVAPAAAAGAAALAPAAKALAPPDALVGAAVRAAGPAVSPRVSALTREVLRAMFVRKLMAGTALGTLAGALLLGGGLALRGPASAGANPVSPPSNNEPPRAEAPRPAPAATSLPAPVTVSQPVRREFIPFEDFTGRLASLPGKDRKAQNESLEGPDTLRFEAWFEVDEGSYLRFQRTVAAGRTGDKGVTVHLGLADEGGFPHEATFDRFGQWFNPQTGTIRAHAILKAPTDIMLPGMFVRVRMPFGKPRPALMVPEAALLTDQGNKYVYVVNDHNVAERRDVKTGQTDGGLRVIEDGLRPGDRVVTAGLHGVKPGASVDPHRSPEPEAKPAARE